MAKKRKWPYFGTKKLPEAENFTQSSFFKGASSERHPRPWGGVVGVAGLGVGGGNDDQPATGGCGLAAATKMLIRAVEEPQRGQTREHELGVQLL